MREIILDTETTGLDPNQGDRVVEIGCVELINKIPTGNVFQCYLNPMAKMSKKASEITGLTDLFLKDKPLFSSKAQEFLEFISDSVLVIHNANFDMKFLNHELGLLGLQSLSMERVVDTLVIARRKFVGAANSLDALCRRFDINNDEREKHGALLDSELLAEVYLHLMGGRQTGLSFTETNISNVKNVKNTNSTQAQKRPDALPSRLSIEEQKAHLAFLESFPVKAKWLMSKFDT